jgi:zinc D-Ala-D-Ala carboxypeptidase
MNLSANFTLKELTKSDTATRLGLDNTPDDAALENLKTLCEKVLQPVRDHFGKSVTVNSGYRSPESNAAVGGSKTSDHCKGMAADIEIVGIANADLAQWIMDNLGLHPVNLRVLHHKVYPTLVGFMFRMTLTTSRNRN